MVPSQFAFLPIILLDKSADYKQPVYARVGESYYCFSPSTLPTQAPVICLLLRPPLDKPDLYCLLLHPVYGRAADSDDRAIKTMSFPIRALNDLDPNAVLDLIHKLGFSLGLSI